jgi:hypothetical protein
MCVGVVTMTGSSGDIETPGTITAGGLDFPVSVVSFSPADGATNVPINPKIVIAFNQFVGKATTGIGTTANITLRNSSGIGTIIETIGVTSTSVTVGSVVTIVPTSILPFNTNIYVVIDEGAFNSAGGNSELIDNYNFTVGEEIDPPLSLEGGFLICRCGGNNWIVAPSSTEVSRTWHLRNDANTRAQQVSGCTGWFIPNCAQLQNPGYTCRNYWDSYSCGPYWTNCQAHPAFGIDLNMGTGVVGGFTHKNTVNCVRAFRCVTY